MPAAAPVVEARRPGAAAEEEQAEAASSRRAPQPVIHDSALRPTRGQAELNDDEDGDGDGAEAAGARRREEPRSVEAAGPLRVLYEGHDLLIINKPPDVRMQGPFDVTVETLVRHWCPEAAPAPVGLKWIHQLDHATSGVLCIGLSRKVAAAAGDLFARRVVAKEYVALLEGHLDVAALPVREEAEIYCAKGDNAGAAGAGGYYNEASLPGIRLEVRRPAHKLGVIYKPASSFYRDKQLAAERRQKEDGGAAVLSPTEAALPATKWREARTALPEVVVECEALAAADKARAVAAMQEQKRQQKEQAAAQEADEDGTSEEEDGGSPGAPVRRREGKDEAEAEVPTQDLGAFRRPRDPEGAFVVDVAITELKHEFRVRLGLPSSNDDASKAAFDPSVYNTGPRRARTVGRVLARGFLTLPGQEGEGEGRAVTKVLLRPVTGRRHQLRVHTLHMGHPIVGDTTYTGDTASPRMMLHAASLTLPFPAGKGPGCTVSVKTGVDPFAPYFQAI